MKNITVTISVSASDTAAAIQMPSIPRISGRKSTTVTWNTRVRRKEIAADTAPLLKAVKKADPKILKPFIRNTGAYSRKP